MASRLMQAVVYVAMLTGISISSVAAAQSVAIEEFSASRYQPAPGPGGYGSVDGALTVSHLAPNLGITFDYAHHPFSLRNADCGSSGPPDCRVDDTNVRLVELTALGHFEASVGLFDRVQIDLVVPVGYVTGDTFTFTDSSGPVTVRGGDAFALGDPRVRVKTRIWGDPREGTAVGAVVYGSFPFGHLTAEDRYLGDETPTVGGHVIGEARLMRFRLAANLGGFFRPERQLLSTRAGSMLTYGAALAYEITTSILVFAELEGATSFSAQVAENPLETRLFGRFQTGDFQVGAGVGAGLVSGVGVPAVRALATFRWTPVHRDQDDDGIDDADDACPLEPEDEDGFLDTDGCPDSDNDDDGLPDASDPCPNDPEDRDGHEDEDGCPDPDNDNDGVRDGFDSCPEIAEDRDGDRDDDGCPDDDRDRDGVDDAVDRCPDEPEDTDGFDDLDGCPEEDVDGDGVPDDLDQCPEQPENRDGVDDEDGCPETAATEDSQDG